jgi:hypothetical protein
MIFGVAHSYELLMADAMIEVRAFNEHTAAAHWLEVPLKTRLDVLRKIDPGARSDIPWEHVNP